jgi:hypothetical protein
MNRSATIFQEQHFTVRDSTIAGCGQGLFTEVPLYPGDTVGPYLGEVISDAQSLTPPYVDSHYLLWVCRDCLIVGENYTRYINHSDQPNVQFVVSTRWKKARVEVVQRVRPGEELFLDYGPEFWAVAEIECL